MYKDIVLDSLALLSYYHNVASNAGDYTIREFSYGIQDTTTVVCGTFGIRIACEIIAVSNPGYGVYTIYAISVWIMQVSWLTGFTVT